MDEPLLKKVQPHSAEAERSVIGSMMLDQEAITIAIEILDAEDFYLQQFRILFEAMYELNEEGKPSDLITIQNKLKEKELPPELSSLEFISGILSSVPTSANIKTYAEIVHEKAVLRRLIKVSEGITNECFLGNKPTEELLEQTEKQVFDIVQNRGSSDFTSIKDIVLESIANMEAAAGNKGGVTGVSTGYYDLDKKTAGLQPSDLVLIAARPSMGKTAFVLNIAEFAAIRSNVTTVIFSLEMSKVQLVNRMIAMNSKVDSQHIRTGNLEDDEWGKIVDSTKVIGDSNLVIDDTSSISIAELRTKCRKLKLEKNLGLVIIDYLQLMTGGKRSESRQQEISDISRSLKALAREISAPVIALSQLSRAVEQRPDKRPMLSDLRESGAIEQDADVVMFLYRDEYYNHDTEDQGIAEVIIGKQRNGPTGKIGRAHV